MKHKVLLLQILYMFSGPQGTIPMDLKGVIPNNNTVCG